MEEVFARRLAEFRQHDGGQAGTAVTRNLQRVSVRSHGPPAIQAMTQKRYAPHDAKQPGNARPRHAWIISDDSKTVPTRAM